MARAVAVEPGDDPVDQAVRAGKCSPARAAHYRRLMEFDPLGTLAILASMPATVPVEEVGAADDSPPQPGAGADGDAYPREWLEAIKPAKPASGRVTFEES